MSIEIITPVGRLVGGHPMVANAVIDDRTGQPKLAADGATPRTEVYIGLAIPKAGEADWKQTEWGAKIHQQAVADWPAGEHGAPAFAWKITDGDSQVPNKRGRKPCDREGFPGHWVLALATGLPVKCYHSGKYDPTQQIQNKNEIKPGDYCRALVGCRGNAPSQSPGVYLNPSLFELSRAGTEIILDSGPSAADAFGGGAATTPAAAAGTPAPAAAAAPVVAPAPDFLNPPGAPAPAAAQPVRYALSGSAYTAEQLAASGWSPEQIAALPRA